MEHPKIASHRRKPTPEKDGGKNYGKPCIKCGIGTAGEKWVQYSYMRGDDETIRVCHACWKTSDEELLKLLCDN